MADVTTAVTVPALKEIFGEVGRLRKDPPSAQELKGIQTYLAGLFVLKNTISPAAVISQLHLPRTKGIFNSVLRGSVELADYLEVSSGGSEVRIKNA